MSEMKTKMVRQRVSSAQRTAMIQFMRHHIFFAKHLIGPGPQGRQVGLRLWGDLRIVLNAMGPAVKSQDGWKQTWSDIKSRVKAKAARIKNMPTGNGSQDREEVPGFGETLTEEEEAVYDICGGRDWIGTANPAIDKRKKIIVNNIPIVFGDYNAKASGVTSGKKWIPEEVNPTQQEVLEKYQYLTVPVEVKKKNFEQESIAKGNKKSRQMEQAYSEATERFSDEFKELRRLKEDGIKAKNELTKSVKELTAVVREFIVAFKPSTNAELNNNVNYQSAMNLSKK